MSEFEKARQEYRDARAGDFPEAELSAARKYIAQLEAKLNEAKKAPAPTTFKSGGKRW